MASSFKQDMPPPGGYGPIEWERILPKKRFGGYATFGIFFGLSAVGWTGIYFSHQRMKRLELEMTEGRIAMEPLILAERERMILRQLRTNRDEENDLMKDVPGWETGTLWGEPVRHNETGRFPHVNRFEYYMHSTAKEMNKRMFEKTKH